MRARRKCKTRRGEWQPRGGPDRGALGLRGSSSQRPCRSLLCSACVPQQTSQGRNTAKYPSPPEASKSYRVHCCAEGPSRAPQARRVRSCHHHLLPQTSSILGPHLSCPVAQAVDLGVGLGPSLPLVTSSYLSCLVDSTSLSGTSFHPHSHCPRLASASLAWTTAAALGVGGGSWRLWPV